MLFLASFTLFLLARKEVFFGRLVLALARNVCKIKKDLNDVVLKDALKPGKTRQSHSR